MPENVEVVVPHAPGPVRRKVEIEVRLPRGPAGQPAPCLAPERLPAQ